MIFEQLNFNGKTKVLSTQCTYLQFQATYSMAVTIARLYGAESTGKQIKQLILKA